MGGVPRRFSAAERVRITDRLLAAGRDAFARDGLRGASVDDLARAAGISKGAFYLFYTSKEALLLDVLRRIEADFQHRILDEVLRPNLTPIESLRIMLRAALEVRGSDPVLRRLTGADAQALLLRIEPEQAVELRQADLVSVRRFLDYWRSRGARITVDEDVLTGLMRALLLSTLHEAEIGPTVFARVLELLIDAIAHQLMPIAQSEEVANARS